MELLSFPRLLFLQDPLTTFFGPIILSSGVFCAGVSLVSILFFLEDFAKGRLLHDVEVQSSMDLHLIFNKVLTT